MQKTYKYYDLILGGYVCVLLCANLIGPAKVSTVEVPVFGSVTFVAGVLFFPISYLFGDILTEVYGYARDRRVVWAGFAALVFAAFMATVVVHLPPADFWQGKQAAVEEIFGNTPRIVAASIVAFWCGSFVNSYVLAKMKVLDAGTLVVDANYRLHAMRRARGLRTFLYDCLRRPVAAGPVDRRHRHAIRVENVVGNRGDAPHVPGRRDAEEGRAGRLLRRGDRLHAVLAESLSREERHGRAGGRANARSGGL